MGAFGAGLIFVPNEIAHYYGLVGAGDALILLQILGAFYFAFAMINWMSKGNLIGGIYNRPIAIGNFTHFFVAGLALIKAAIASPSALMVGFAAVYSTFAGLFGLILFTHPGKKDT